MIGGVFSKVSVPARIWVVGGPVIWKTRTKGRAYLLAFGKCAVILVPIAGENEAHFN